MGIYYKKNICEELHKAGYSSYNLQEKGIMASAGWTRLEQGTIPSMNTLDKICTLLQVQRLDIKKRMNLTEKAVIEISPEYKMANDSIGKLQGLLASGKTDDVTYIRNHRLISKRLPIYRYIYDVQNGELHPIEQANRIGQAIEK